MSGAPLSYWDYVKAAFNVRLPIPGLGGLPVNWLALGVAAVAAIPFWPIALIAAGLEVGFLALLSNHPRFQAHVQRMRKWEASNEQELSFQEQVTQLASQLSDTSKDRFERLQRRVARVEQESAAALRTLAEDGLLRLEWIYLKLLGSEELLRRQVGRSQRAQLLSELEENQAKLEEAKDQDERIRKSIRSTIEILERRITNLDTALSNLAFIEAELTRIEHQADLIVEETALAKDANALSTRIDAVTATFDETQEWVRLNQDILSETSDELDPPRPAQRLKV